MVIHYTIPLEPKTKKNSQHIIYRNGKPLIVQGDAYLNYENDCRYFLRPRPSEPIDYPVNIRCEFYRKTARRVDITNLLSAIHDVLVKWEILKDDSFGIVASVDGSRVFVDRENPRTEIYIEELTQ